MTDAMTFLLAFAIVVGIEVLVIFAYWRHLQRDYKRWAKLEGQLRFDEWMRLMKSP